MQSATTSGREEAWGDLTNAYKYPRGGCREDGARLFSVAPRDKRQWAQTQTQEVLSQHQETPLYFFAVRVTEDRRRLRREVYGVSILGDTQKPTVRGPGQPALSDPA